MVKALLLCASITVLYFTSSITVLVKDQNYYTLGKPSTDPADKITFEFQCCHGHKWGIYFDLGHKRPLFGLFGNKSN